jgi:hypothetical protein
MDSSSLNRSIKNRISLISGFSGQIRQAPVPGGPAIPHIVADKIKTIHGIIHFRVFITTYSFENGNAASIQAEAALSEFITQVLNMNYKLLLLFHISPFR